MSRAFNRAASDYIEFSPGSAAALNGGGMTSLFLWTADTAATAHGLFIARTATPSTVWGINPYSDNRIYYTSAGFVAADTIAAGVWYLLGFTKAAGSAQVRSHFYNYTSAVWTHTNWGALGDSGAGSAATMRLGWFSGSDMLNGKIAAAALYNTVLTDLQIEGLTTTLQSWMNLNPVWAVRLNQTSVATAVPDLTNGGGNQSAISGTSVSASEPPGWSYTLSKSVSIGQPVDTGIALPFSRQKLFNLGLPTEVDSALALAHQKSRTLGLPVDTGVALPMSRQKKFFLGLPTETDIALPVKLPIKRTVHLQLNYRNQRTTPDLTVDMNS